MAERSAHGHTEDRHDGVAAAGTGEDQLAQRAATQQDGGKADQEHAQHGPEEVSADQGVEGDRLAVKAPGKLAADEVAHEDGNEDGDEAPQQVQILQHDGVTDAAGHTETGLLCKSTDHKAGNQSNVNGSMHGAGPFQGEGQQSLGHLRRFGSGVRGGLGSSGVRSGDTGAHQQQDQQDDVNCRQGIALQCRHVVSTLEGKALAQKDRADPDAEHKAEQTEERIAVTAAEADDHTQRAAQEHQGADHDEEAEDKTHDRGRAAFGLELAADQSHHHGTEDNTDNFRTDILDYRRGVHLDTAGNITDKAGDAEAHVAGIAEGGQNNGGRTDHQAGENDQKMRIRFLHRKEPPCSLRTFSSGAGGCSLSPYTRIPYQRPGGGSQRRRTDTGVICQAGPAHHV